MLTLLKINPQFNSPLGSISSWYKNESNEADEAKKKGLGQLLGKYNYTD